jgi:hypothetical protein
LVITVVAGRLREAVAEATHQILNRQHIASVSFLSESWMPSRREICSTIAGAPSGKLPGYSSADDGNSNSSIVQFGTLRSSAPIRFGGGFAASVIARARQQVLEGSEKRVCKIEKIEAAF